jgi:hypothetical protein
VQSGLACFSRGSGEDQPVAGRREHAAIESGGGHRAGDCANLGTVAARRLELDRKALTAAPPPDPATAATLFDFLTQRLATSWTELGCTALTGHGPLI